MNGPQQSLFDQEVKLGNLQLRLRQVVLIEKLAAAFREGYRNIMVCAPCGFGKTEVATALLIKTRDNGKRGAFICDRIQLVQQTGERFDKYGLDHGVMQSNHWRHRPMERIQLCSIQTLIRRHWPDAHIYIHDEAHVLTESAKKRLSERKGFSVGLSATPMTKGLGKYFDIVITAATTAELIEEKLLVPFRIFAPSEPNLKGVKVVAGEYDEKQTESRCLPIVGDCVQEYCKHAHGKKFICFAVSVDHARELQRQFMAAGIVAELYTYKEGDEERKATVDEFRKPDSYIRGLISIESLSRGFDVTDVEVMICARPLRKAIHVFIQMLGRILRTHPGKDHALLLDHSGNAVRFYEELMDYIENGVDELDDGKQKEKEPPKEKERKALKCPQCFHVHDAAPTCPNCGWEYPRKPAVQHEAGELEEFGGVVKAGMPDKQRFFAMLNFIRDEHNARHPEKPWSQGWVSHKYREKFGVWPIKMDEKLRIPPDQEMRGWVKAGWIRWLKSKEKREALAS